MKCHMKCRSCLFPLNTVHVPFKYTTEILRLFEKIENNLEDGESSINSIPVLCLPLRLALRRVWTAYLNRDNLLLFPILLSQNERCLQHHRGLKKGGGGDKHLNKGIRYFQPQYYKAETGISNRITFFFLSPMVLRFSPFHPKYVFPHKCIIFLPSTKLFTRS